MHTPYIQDMAVHDLDMSRFLMGTDPESILAFGSCHVDERIQVSKQASWCICMFVCMSVREKERVRAYID